MAVKQDWPKTFQNSVKHGLSASAKAPHFILLVAVSNKVALPVCSLLLAHVESLLPAVLEAVVHAELTVATGGDAAVGALVVGVGVAPVLVVVVVGADPDDVHGGNRLLTSLVAPV